MVIKNHQTPVIAIPMTMEGPSPKGRMGLSFGMVESAYRPRQSVKGMQLPIYP